MKRWLILCLYLFVCTEESVVLAQEIDSIFDTRHNLAIRVPASALTDKEGPLCIFCHTPHTGAAKIGVWDNDQAGTLFDYPYDRPSGREPTGKPSGVSLTCLSCHDGTIALGDVFNRTDTISTPANMNGEISRTNYADGHPISFVYDQNLINKNTNLKSPQNLPAGVKLDSDKKLQCNTCHDPHSDRYDNFLVVDNQETALCEACHKKTGWEGSSHKNSTVQWNHRGIDPWPYSDLGRTVAQFGCQNCHTPHTAGSGKSLLNYSREEDNCTACHNGNVARSNILAEINKFSNHPVEATNGVHEVREPALIQSSNRHVECVDCHEPHAVNTKHENGLSGALIDLAGVGVNGIEKANITMEYELCFRCHADSTGRPAPPTPRVHDQTNVRLQFDNGNPSFHPITDPGTNRDVPSLLTPMTENDIIKCSDCHGSDNSSEEGDRSPRGPHGSIYPSLLVRQYQTQDNTPESPIAYALCYTCHDRDSILRNESFKQHGLHVSTESTPCNVCHDPHGISSVQGNDSNNTHLINFDRSIVLPNASNELRFEDRGSVSGACFLNCHNSEHNGLSY